MRRNAGKAGSNMPSVSENNIPVVESPVYNTYEIDNTDVCELLESILKEMLKNNEMLSHVTESLDEVKENILKEELEEALSEVDPEDLKDDEDYQELVVELLGKMDDTLITLGETVININDTVSGNSLYLEDTNNTTAELLRSYIEVSTQQTQNEAYGLALGVTISFIISLIVGILIAKIVWGKTR